MSTIQRCKRYPKKQNERYKSRQVNYMVNKWKWLLLKDARHLPKIKAYWKGQIKPNLVNYQLNQSILKKTNQTKPTQLTQGKWPKA